MFYHACAEKGLARTIRDLVDQEAADQTGDVPKAGEDGKTAETAGAEQAKEGTRRTRRGMNIVANKTRKSCPQYHRRHTVCNVF